MNPMSPSELAKRFDHTLLKPEATPHQVDKLCDEAMEFGFHCVCVNPVYVPRCVARLSGSGVVVGSVAGFPLGCCEAQTVADEARRAVDAGAEEVDMVTWIGGLIAQETKCVIAGILAVARVVHAAGPRRILKVILETAALTDEQIILGCRCCAEGEADFVKTSTGFHQAGGASAEHVRLLHRHASPIKVKASGGIRDLDTALKMLEAGADRLGASASVTIVQDLAKRAT